MDEAQGQFLSLRARCAFMTLLLLRFLAVWSILQVLAWALAISSPPLPPSLVQFGQGTATVFGCLTAWNLGGPLVWDMGKAWGQHLLFVAARSAQRQAASSGRQPAEQASTPK